MAARRKRIGVLTFHKCINYGSYWQARSLVEGLRARGHDAELLDHDCRQVALAELRCAFQPQLPHRTERSDLRSHARKTRKFFDAFRGLPMSRSFSLHEPAAAQGYDAVVVGSDEVWNFRHPWYSAKPIFFGDGLGTDRLVSYAASFGNHSAADGIDPYWAAKLQRFDALSVRDENSRRLVKDGVGTEPEMVLDPCLQFSPVVRSEDIPSGRYALVYGYSFPDWLIAAVRSWSERSGIPLLSIGYRNRWADEHRIDASPAEFAELMAGAQAVVTNFFHGCVFALANGKPWLAVLSEYRSIKIPDLVSLLGAEHRLIDERAPQSRIDDLLGTPVLPRVKEKIAERRERSGAFLDQALG